VARRRDRLLQQPECHVRQGITGWRNPVARGRARPRPRPALPLSLEEREAISHGLAHRKTLTGIAGELGRSVSTVSRGGRSQRRTERLPRRSSGVAGHHPHRPATSGKLADDPMLRSYQEDTSWKNRFAASCRR
jgi:hypothetical protein